MNCDLLPGLQAGTLRRALACSAGIVLAASTQFAAGHDSISATTREFYLTRLAELDRATRSNGAPAARAEALIRIGNLLDEIRELLNADIASHGKAQGLETALLIAKLDATPYKLNVSLQTRLYLAPLQPYRDALSADPNGAAANAARFKIFKGQFYDSFVHNPLEPSQTREQLLERIALGESLLRGRDPAVDPEEVAFILAIHYLQARRGAALPAARTRQRFTELLKDFRRNYPQSLKLATLEALSP